MNTYNKIYLMRENRRFNDLSPACFTFDYIKPYGIYVEDVETVRKKYCD